MFFPYSTERELARTPWATLALIGVNVAVASVTLFSLERTLLLAFSPDAFHWWQPLTAMFTHGGIELVRWTQHNNHKAKLSHYGTRAKRRDKA